MPEYVLAVIISEMEISTNNNYSINKRENVSILKILTRGLAYQRGFKISFQIFIKECEYHSYYSGPGDFLELL